MRYIEDEFGDDDLDTCNRCGGTGDDRCSYCADYGPQDGSDSDNCSVCFGSGFMPCPECNDSFMSIEDFEKLVDSGELSLIEGKVDSMYRLK